MKVILCGFNWSGCKALDLLLNQGHEVFVYTHEAPRHMPCLISFCMKRNIHFSTRNISQSELPFTPDIICSIYYRYIINNNIIKKCGGKIFNLHPSLLPKYRGCSSVTWAMIEGETESGFTYHYINDRCDSGPIILQKPITIEEWDTQQSLYMRVMHESMKYFQEAFNAVANGFPGIPQVGESNYYPRQCPYLGQIDTGWDENKIERFIRAMIYPPYPPANFHSHEIYTMEDYYNASRIRE